MINLHRHPVSLEDITSMVQRFPFHTDHVKKLADEFPEAHPLIITNPALAFCISTVTLLKELPGEESAHSISVMLRARRRDACALLGFPGTKATVRILAKIQPEACFPQLLLRLRAALRAPELNKILQQIQWIDSTVLGLAVFWGDAPAISPTLFSELAIECEHGIDRPITNNFLDDLLKFMQTRKLSGLSVQTVGEIRRCLYATALNDTIKDVLWNDELTFPPPPFEGTSEIRPIRTYRMLRDEGYRQNHCVATLAGEIAARQLYVYKILAPERATLSIVRFGNVWRSGEIRAECNHEVTGETMKFIHEWLRKSQRLFIERIEVSKILRHALGTFSSFERRLRSTTLRNKPNALHLC